MEGKQKVYKGKLLDENFDLEKAYFYKDISESKWAAIKTFLKSYFKEAKNSDALATFFQGLPVIRKGGRNVKQLRKVIDEIAEEYKSLPSFFESYKVLTNYVADEYLMAKPAVLESVFFPSEINEDRVVNMLRTVRKTLEIAIFSLTNDKLFAAIEEAWNDGLDIRIITDDECANQLGSDIYRLAAMGIPVKTDCNKQFHMHHKFAILDHAVVMTGSFNWTVQAVKNNQENILFFENPAIANVYLEEFNRLWKEFTTVIDADEAMEKVRLERENKRRKK